MKLRQLLLYRNRLLPHEKWALAAGGVLTETNFERYDCISVKHSKRSLRVSLADWWDATDRKSLLGKLEWLKEEGHRTDLQNKLFEINLLIAGTNPGDEIDLTKHGKFIVDHLHMLNRLRFVAWDHSRMINLARWALACEYISNQEAWDWIRCAALVMRNELGSWKDLGDDFVLGYRYWSLDKLPIPSIISAYDRLMKKRNSPWNTIPWNINPEQLARCGTGYLPSF